MREAAARSASRLSACQRKVPKYWLRPTMNAEAPTVDAKTGEVIRNAVAVASAGRIAEACAIGEQGLANGCDPVPLHAMLGLLLSRQGDFARALTHLEPAFAALPNDPLVARNLVGALVECERYEEAATLLTGDLVALDRSGDLERLRGFVAQQLGNLPAAASAYEQVVAAHPDDWESWNNLGNAREALDDAAGAVKALRKAVELNPQAVQVRLNLALALRMSGDVAQAEIELRQMTADFPHEATPWQYLFGLLKEQSWEAEAKEMLEGALERDPQNIGMLISLGREQLFAFDMAEATQSFRTVLSLDPTNADAYLGLADIAERQRPEALAAVLAEAEAAGVEPLALKLIRGLLARRTRRYAAGIAALADIPNDSYPLRRWFLQGQLLDRLGDSDEAFASFARLNEVQAADPTKPLVRAAALKSELAANLELLTTEWRDGWAAPAITSPRPAPVFLGGFPRSGTTLLDTMLMGHPDVEVMEERPVLHQLKTEIGDLDSFARMSDREVRHAQDRYFELAADHAQLRDSSVLVDKSPLHTQNVAQIYRLFPDARFILALRHPADVVLSCFMARFRLNSAMSNFLRLDTAAEFYDLTFRLWERSLSLFPVDVRTVVYEEMVRDPETVLKPLIEGLGLQWNEQVLDHEGTAKKRGIITTASYAQVTQPIYLEAAGRWERYRDHLEAILPVLRPWAEKFGYGL